MADYRDFLVDPMALDAALAGCRARGDERWDLANAGQAMIAQKRYLDALRVFDVLVELRDLEGHAYCNALWLAQHDNTGLPHDPARARRYLAGCLPHAPTNTPIHLNAAGVLCELGDVDAAVDQLLCAAYGEVKISPYLNEPLFAPLKTHPRWPELKAAARVPKLTFDQGGKAPAEQCVTSMLAALDHPDLRARQAAVRALLRFSWENGDDGHGGRPRAWLAKWYEAMRKEIARRVKLQPLFQVILRDLRAAYPHQAALSVRNFALVHRWDVEVVDATAPLLPALATALRDGDVFVQEQIAHVVSDFVWNEALRAGVLAHCVPVILAQVEQLSSEGSISDFANTRRELLHQHLDSLTKLDAGASVGPAVARMLTASRGEVFDTHLQGELVKFIGLVREKSAVPELIRLVLGEARTPAYAAAIGALGRLGDARAIPALVAALKTEASCWPESYVLELRRQAGESLRQLGVDAPPG